MALLDPHSFCDDSHAKIENIELELYLDFDQKILRGLVRLIWSGEGHSYLDLDTRDLEIDRITDLEGEELAFSLDHSDPIKGQRLRIQCQEDARPRCGVVIYYQTSPTANALQWLDAIQTSGQNHPFVFTQCQPIHARSIFPCQDSPKNRISYRAELNIPRELACVMAAKKKSRTEDGERAVESFEMKQAIPTYLFAFAVGNIVHREIGPRSRVFAEPSVVEAAAYEFAEVESMISTAESLFGPYDWERFDLLVMPSSFPYGGMENPRLTFLTPTVIVGDRSLVNIIAHELAHSWTGNLVTNASMNDFWLNEGFTTYAERRILEALEGKERADLHVAVGWQGLQSDLASFGPQSDFSRLKNDLLNVDPDKVFSRIPYEKGFLFIRRIEEIIGRNSMDAFLRNYMQAFRFQSITTEQFIEFLREQCPKLVDKIDLSEWIFGRDLPKDAPRPKSTRLQTIVQAAQGFYENARTGKERDEVNQTEHSEMEWTPQEWQVFLGHLATQSSPKLCAKLDERFSLLGISNLEIRVSFLIMAINCGYEPAFEVAAECLKNVGRMKYLRPLYSALHQQNPKSRKLAKDVFETARNTYHPVASALVEGILGRDIK